jgi:hypothetical protein
MTREEAGLIGSKKAAVLAQEEKAKKTLHYNEAPNFCRQCNKPLDYEKRKNVFCNHSCAQSFNNVGVRRHGKDPIKMCANCKKEFKSNAFYFCSIKCWADYNFNEWCKRVEKLGYFENYNGSDSGSGVAKPKKYSLLKQNGKCLLCGINEWQGKPVPFVLDHIDGDSTNWRINNIRVLCRNCDGQLPTYCGRNKGKGTREYVNIRGKNGKHTVRKKHSI